MFDLEKETSVSLNRLLPRVTAILQDSTEQDIFCTRLQRHFPTAFKLLYDLYGQQYDFFYHLEQMVLTTARFYAARSADLKALDQQREQNPYWFLSEQIMGGVCYVDLFAGDLAGISAKIPYFEELGLTYLHLMPLFRCPPEHNDGGYAISSFREVNPSLGTIEQLADLARELREHQNQSGTGFCL